MSTLPALALAFALAAPAAVQSGGLAITQPDWTELPSGEDLAEEYPQLAQLLMFEGSAVIACTVAVNGTLQDCQAVTETPPGLGFAAGALAMSKYFRMRAMTVDGKPVSGGQVRIPLRFKLPPSETPSAPQPTSAAALEQARTLVDEMGSAAATRREFEAMAQQLEYLPERGVPQETRDAAAEAMRTAVRQHEADIREAAALALASVLTEDELKLQIGLINSPAGALMRPDQDLAAVINMMQREFFRRTRAEARAVFCAARACEIDPQALQGQTDGVNEAPIWAEQPGTNDIFAATPSAAAVLGVNGAARLVCGVKADGRLWDCKTTGASPPGLGFDDAALGLSKAYRLLPSLAGDGDAKVAVKVAFSGEDLPEPFEGLTGPPERMALARQAAATDPGVSASLAQMKSAVAEALPPDDGDDETTASARAALLQGSVVAAEALREQYAGLYASQLDEPALRRLIDIRRSDVGVALEAKASRVQTALGEAGERAITEILKDAKRLYCQARPCPPLPALTGE